LPLAWGIAYPLGFCFIKHQPNTECDLRPPVIAFDYPLMRISRLGKLLATTTASGVIPVSSCILLSLLLSRQCLSALAQSLYAQVIFLSVHRFIFIQCSTVPTQWLSGISACLERKQQSPRYRFTAICAYPPTSSRSDIRANTKQPGLVLGHSSDAELIPCVRKLSAHTQISS